MQALEDGLNALVVAIATALSHIMAFLGLGEFPPEYYGNFAFGLVVLLIIFLVVRAAIAIFLDLRKQFIPLFIVFIISTTLGQTSNPLFFIISLGIVLIFFRMFQSYLAVGVVGFDVGGIAVAVVSALTVGWVVEYIFVQTATKVMRRTFDNLPPPFRAVEFLLVTVPTLLVFVFVYEKFNQFMISNPNFTLTDGNSYTPLTSFEVDSVDAFIGAAVFSIAPCIYFYYRYRQGESVIVFDLLEEATRNVSNRLLTTFSSNKSV